MQPALRSLHGEQRISSSDHLDVKACRHEHKVSGLEALISQTTSRRLLVVRKLLEKGMDAVCIASTHEQGVEARVE